MHAPNEAVAEKVRNLPRQPGIYKFKDADGKTIYVGKATSLRARVGSYFQNPESRGGKTAALVVHRRMRGTAESHRVQLLGGILVSHFDEKLQKFRT